MPRHLCGWCGHATAGSPCSSCGRDSVLPWTQRGLDPPVVRADTGRPQLDEAVIRALYQAARSALVVAGRPVTVEALAEELDRAPRTVRDWRKRFGLD